MKRLTDVWMEEKKELNRVQDVKEELEKARIDLEAARRRGDFAKAGELLHGTIPHLEHELEDLEHTVERAHDGKKHHSTTKMLSDSVSADAIATIIARHTGIPVSRIAGDESQKLLHMEEKLRKRVVGQDHALAAVSDCVRLARTRLQAQNRTLGNFLFLGPTVGGLFVWSCVRCSINDGRSTNHFMLFCFVCVCVQGVGKTETAKALAEFVFDDEDAMTRIDMSEYGEKHTVSRLIGAPPGYSKLFVLRCMLYGCSSCLFGRIHAHHVFFRPWSALAVGYDEAGVLTESVRRRPYQILLLDEFEKAHRDVWNLLLQLFDEGHLTDSHGRTVDFRNVIVIMTSNLGAQVIAELPEHLRGSEPQVQEAIMEVVRQNLSPELLNRIDDTIVFNRLQRENMDTIADIGIQEIAKRLEEGQSMTLDVSMNAKDVLASMGFDVRYGARPLKRVLARELLNPLSRLVLEGAVKTGDTVQVRTRAEAEKAQKGGEAEFGWICSNEASDNKNDVVIIRNHEQEKEEDEKVWDDDEYLMEDGTHAHR